MFGVTVVPPDGSTRAEAEGLLLADVGKKLWGRWARVDCVHSARDMASALPAPVGGKSPGVWWQVEFQVRRSLRAPRRHVSVQVVEREVTP